MAGEVYISANVIKQPVNITARLAVNISNTGGTCDDVTILDQDGNIYDTVPSGGTYNVIVFTGIKDVGVNSQINIIDGGN